MRLPVKIYVNGAGGKLDGIGVNLSEAMLKGNGGTSTDAFLLKQLFSKNCGFSLLVSA
jgi:hypothetical protein